MLIGNKVTLSSVEEENIEQLRLWRNRPELRKYFREYKEISKTMQAKWFQKINTDPNQVNFEIRTKDGDTLIGHCGLFYINWITKSAEFSIYVGDDSYRNGGYGSDALRTLIKYGFEDLNLNKICCEVFENNKSIELYKRIGFVYEGTMRQNYYNEGRYWDSHFLSILKEEYETSQ